MRADTVFFFIAVSAALFSPLATAAETAPPPGVHLTRLATIPVRMPDRISTLLIDPAGRYLMPLSSMALLPHVSPVIEIATGQTIGGMSIDRNATYFEPSALMSDPCRIIATEWKPGFATSAVVLDCAGEIVQRLERPDGQPLLATDAISPSCGIALTKLRGPLEAEKRDLADQEYTAFDLATGQVDEAHTRLFAKGDQEVSLTQSGACKAYVMRYGEPEAALSLDSSHVRAEMTRLSQLWEIDLATGASRKITAFPGAPTVNANLSVDASPVLSRNGNLVGVPSTRFEVLYDPDGRLRIGQYRRLEIVNLETGTLLAPFRCPYNGASIAGAFLAGNDYAFIAGCRGLSVGRAGANAGMKLQLYPRSAALAFGTVIFSGPNGRTMPLEPFDDVARIIAAHGVHERDRDLDRRYRAHRQEQETQAARAAAKATKKTRRSGTR